jgi:hypothetical protein
MGVACSIKGNRRRCRNRVDIDYPETGGGSRTNEGARTLEAEHRFCRILGANQSRCDTAGLGLVAPRCVRLATMVSRINPGAIRFGHARPIAGRAASTIAPTTFVHDATLEPAGRRASALACSRCPDPSSDVDGSAKGFLNRERQARKPLITALHRPCLGTVFSKSVPNSNSQNFAPHTEL